MSRCLVVCCSLLRMAALVSGLRPDAKSMAMHSGRTSPYVPGTPGATWTQQEMDAVRTHLKITFRNSWMEFQDTGVRAGTLLRLSFHDCLKNTDGTGGCDGCINWDGVDETPFVDSALKKDFSSDVHKDNNNFLGDAVRTLEEIYTQPLGQGLTHSLHGTGKSRADLWAFSGIVAVEYTMDINNAVCSNGRRPNSSDATQEDFLGLGQCLFAQGQPECEAVPPRLFRYSTGRRDCITSIIPNYKADKKEVHPNDHGNGESTTRFMKDNFGFNGRETVAIMGAHTIGRYHTDFTGFKYVWTPRSEWSFNNEYYRNMVLDPGASWVFNNDQCTFLGDAWGRQPHDRWAVKANLHSTTGGPIQWIKMSHVGPDCVQPGWETLWWSDAYKECCHVDVPTGATSRPDNNRSQDSDSLESDDNQYGGCEKWKFLSARDHAMLNTDMGLYLHFDTNDDGYPQNCPGLEGFDAERATSLVKLSEGVPIQGGRLGNRWAWQDCEKETHAEPEEDLPLHSYVEMFAANQTAWLEVFVPAMEKYLANGYDEGELTPMPVDAA